MEGIKNRNFFIFIYFICAWKLKECRTPLVRSHVTQLWEARQQNLPRRRLGQNRRAMMGLDLFWVLEASFFLCWPKNRICVNDAENTRLWWWLCRYREGVTTVENRWVIQHIRTRHKRVERTILSGALWGSRLCNCRGHRRYRRFWGRYS